MNITIPYSPQKASKTLFSIVLFLISVGIIGQVSKYFFGHGRLLGFVTLFDLNREGNIPSWYSSVTLLLCAFLLANIASIKKGFPYSAHWKALSFLFVYMSIDESVALHERWNFFMQPFISSGFLSGSGFLYAPWIVPGFILVVVILIAYIKFLGHLPRRTKWLFLLAGTVYVGGAVGVELIEGYLLGDSGIETFGYQMAVVLQEFSEMFGIIIFTYALLSYLEKILPNSLSLDNPQEDKGARAPINATDSRKATQE